MGCGRGFTEWLIFIGGVVSTWKVCYYRATLSSFNYSSVLHTYVSINCLYLDNKEQKVISLVG